MTIISHGHQGSPTPVLIRVLVFNMIQTLFLAAFFLEGTPGTDFKKEIPVSSLLGDDLSCFKQAGSLARYTGHPTSLKKNGTIALHPRFLNVIQPQMIASHWVQDQREGSKDHPGDLAPWTPAYDKRRFNRGGAHHSSESLASCWPPGKDGNILILSLCFFNSLQL